MEKKKEKPVSCCILLHLVGSCCLGVFLFFRVSNSQTCWESGHSLISCINFSATVVGTSPSNHTSPYLQQPKSWISVWSDIQKCHVAQRGTSSGNVFTSPHVPKLPGPGHLRTCFGTKKSHNSFRLKGNTPYDLENDSNLWYQICPGPKLFVPLWASASYVSLHLRYAMKLKDFTKLLEKADFNPSKCDLPT